MKAQPKVKAPPPDAIPIKTKNAARKYTETAASQPNKWREKQVDRPNQLYTPGGQALSSDMYQMQGGGGVGVGTNSPFGSQFGYYANLLRDQVARAWKTTDVDPRLATSARWRCGSRSSGMDRWCPTRSRSRNPAATGRSTFRPCGRCWTQVSFPRSPPSSAGTGQTWNYSLY